MNFRRIILDDDLEDELIRLVSEDDFNFYDYNPENADYLFIGTITLENEEGNDVPVTEVKIVFDKNSGLWFSLHRDLVSPEERERLEDLEDEEDEDEDEDEEEYEEEDEGDEDNSQQPLY